MDEERRLGRGALARELLGMTHLSPARNSPASSVSLGRYAHPRVNRPHLTGHFRGLGAACGTVTEYGSSMKTLRAPRAAARCARGFRPARMTVLGHLQL